MSDNEKLTEFQTRKIYIDKALEKRGWVIKDKKQVIGEYLIDWAKDTQGNPVNERYVDYLLFDNVGDPLAVVEAKKYSRNPFEGKEQAEELVTYGIRKTHRIVLHRVNQSRSIDKLPLSLLDRIVEVIQFFWRNC